ETHGYIQHRLEVAGAGDREIFAPDTFAEIFRYCGGVPRLINTLCDTAMMSAFTADRGVVTREDIASAVQELQWLQYGARVHQRPSGPAPPAHPAGRPTAGREATSSLGHLLVATDGRTVQEVPLRLGRLIV